MRFRKAAWAVAIAGLLAVSLLRIYEGRVEAAGYISDVFRFIKVAAPSTPPTGRADCYVDSTSSLFSCKDSSGTVTTIGGASGSGWNPLDTTVMLISEDFCGGDNSNGSARTGQNGWKMTNIGAGSWVGSSGGTSGITQHPCLYRNTTAATAGTGGGIALANNATSANFNTDDITSEEWEHIWIVRFSSITDVRLRAGWIGGDSTIVPPASALIIRYDTSSAYNDDAKGSGAGRWVAQTCSTCTGDTSGTTVEFGTAPVADTWYRLRLRRVASGVGGLPTIYMQVNSGTEVTFCSSGCNATLTFTANAGLSPTLTFGTDSANARTVDLDFFALQIAGLSRY